MEEVHGGRQKLRIFSICTFVLMIHSMIGPICVCFGDSFSQQIW